MNQHRVLNVLKLRINSLWDILNQFEQYLLVASITTGKKKTLPVNFNDTFIYIVNNSDLKLFN